MSNSVVCIGDSITNGAAGALTAYPQLMAFLLGPEWSTVNAGVVGSKTPAMLSLYNASVTGKGYNFVPILAGVNDALGGDASAGTISNLEDMYDGCLADTDCLPILVTITPCGTGPGWSAGAQTKIEAINTAIRAYAVTNDVPIFDAYVDMAEPGLPTQLASIYSTDGLHHNQAGAERLAEQISALILANV